MRSWGFLGGFTCVLLAACSVGTPYRQAPDSTAECLERDLGGTRTIAWPASDWWHRFGSSQLDDLIDQARRTNDDLAAAMARVQEADAQLRIAGAPLLPTVDLGASATRERTEISGGGMGVYNVFSPVLTASYELDFWGKNRAARDAAHALAVASRYDRQTVALTVISSVATTYLQALELRERIEVARQNLENGRKILRGLAFQQQVGTATGLDVAQQETAVALLDAALPPLEQQFRQTVYALAVLVGKTPESLDVSDGTLNDLKVPQVVAGLPSELLDAPTRRRRGRATAGCRERGHHGRARGAVPIHHAHRLRRIRERRSLLARQPGQSHLRGFRRAHTTDLSRRCAARPARLLARRAIPNC